MRVPHLVQYQGSKRLIAPEIIKFFPEQIDRLVEPFSGTCAMSILASAENRCNSFWVNDINRPLIKMMEKCINDPETLAKNYEKIWLGQFDAKQDNIEYYYKIRSEFNDGKKDPARMLFLLARMVKGSVRYNVHGELNQSCDKRRYGTKPELVESNALRISELLKEKTIFTCLDYKEVLAKTRPGDLIYMDPPYQGTSNSEKTRDNRYIKGVDFDEFVGELEKLNERGIDFIVSYDGKTGDRVIGKQLPETLGLSHLYIEAGRSAQATLNGKNEITYESLYTSKGLKRKPEEYQQLSLCFG